MEERIIAAAYRLKHTETSAHKRLTYKNPRLWVDEVPSYDDIYDLRIGRHHAEILHIFGNEVDHKTSGFYTSYGRYVDRVEAAKIALACGQCEEPLVMGDRLDSSDVFDK